VIAGTPYSVATARIRFRLSAALINPTGVATIAAGRVPDSIQSASASAAVGAFPIVAIASS